MNNSARLLIRFPLLLLAAVDLALLARRLQPWQDISKLPGAGSTGYDPAICLLVYMAIVLWLTGKTGIRLVSAPVASTLLGAISGAVLALRVWISTRPPAAQTGEIQAVLLLAAIAICAFSGIPAARAAGNAGAGLISGFWASIVAGLVGSAAILGQFFGLPQTQDSYRQFQDIGIGSEATATLVHALTAATALLLIGPLVVTTLAVILGWMGGRTGKKRAA